MVVLLTRGIELVAVIIRATVGLNLSIGIHGGPHGLVKGSRGGVRSDVFVCSVSLAASSPSHFTLYLALATAATIVPCSPFLPFFFHRIANLVCALHLRTSGHIDRFAPKFSAYELQETCSGMVWG